MACQLVMAPSAIKELFRIYFWIIVVLVATSWPLSCLGDLSQPGPFATGSTTVTITRSDASTLSALMYYPATTSGPDVPLDPTGGPYSAITFGHGFLQQPARYFGTLEHLATYGYLVIAPTSEVGLFPNHLDFASDMQLTFDYLTARNADPADPLFEYVDIDNFGLLGHSMGAGSGLLAAANDRRIRAFAGLATAITNPSPEPLMPEIQAAVALLSGDEDGIIDYTTATVPLYNSATAPKLQPLILGGCHVGFQDDPFPFFADSGSLPAAEQLAMTRRYLTSYFGLYLKGDQSLWRNIWGPEAFAQSGLPTEANPGVTLTADRTSQTLAAGQTATYMITATNTGPSTNSFSLFVEDHVWSTMLGVEQTPELAPAEQFVFSIQVTVPLNEEAGIRDTVLLSARSNKDRGSRGDLILNTMDAVDFDADGTVDRDDLLAWKSGYGILDGATFAQGDADTDGNVDGNDFLAWQRKFGRIASRISSANLIVPEPISASLMLILAAAMVLAFAVDHQ